MRQADRHDGLNGWGWVTLNWLAKLLGGERPGPKVPDGCCVYAVGDIHGRLDLLEVLLARIWDDAADGLNILIFLGDYVDRGPQSRQVIEYLINLQRPGWEIIKLRGNHEQALLNYLSDSGFYQAWRTFGGTETLLSYGVRPPIFSDTKELERAHGDFLECFPQSHKVFLMGQSCSHSVGDYFFVHAGVRPGIALDQQLPEDMMGIREDFLLSNTRLAKVIVHGHTPVDRPIMTCNRICIDTGAYATNRLTAAKLQDDHCTFLCTDDTQRPT